MPSLPNGVAPRRGTRCMVMEYDWEGNSSSYAIVALPNLIADARWHLFTSSRFTGAFHNSREAC